MASEAREALRKESARVAQERAALEAEKEALEDEKTRVAECFKDSEQVELSIGGHLFSTTVSTLRNAPHPSLFAAMFSGRHELKRDGNGRIFIDRDGRHFHDVLNWLRDGKFPCPCPTADSPAAVKYLVELRAEADYYGLEGLVREIDRQPWGMTRVRRCLEISADESWIYEDGPDELIFSVDRPCQLLGVGLCAPRSWFNARLTLSTVSQEFLSPPGAELRTEPCPSSEVLQVASRTFTAAEGEGGVCKMDLAPEGLVPGKLYMISALIKGGDSLCCDDCLPEVWAQGVGITFAFHESPNGTSDERGQFPELYVRVFPGS